MVCTKANPSLQIEEITVDTYLPQMEANGACLALGLMFAVQTGRYEFDYMTIRRTESPFVEPLVYKAPSQLIMKEICADLQESMAGNYKSIYVQLKERETGDLAGITLWNVPGEGEKKSFSITYKGDGKLDELVQNTYRVYQENQDRILKRLSVSEEN